MRIRRARPADVRGVSSIEDSHAATPRWTLEEFSAELSVAESVFLIAENSEKLLGFTIARRHPPRLELLDIAVADQRRGVGSALIEALKAEAAGCQAMTLEVSADNTAALSFYAAQGFRVVGRRPKFYNGVDAVLMDLVLGDPASVAGRLLPGR